MKTNYIKPEIKVVVLNSEDILDGIYVGNSSQTINDTPLSKGATFDKDDADWDD